MKRAGSTLRKYRRGELADHDAAANAILVVQRHRAAHQQPLVHANNGLRSMVRTTHCDGRVTQRLKRMSTILDKLERENSLSLDKMQDIGGCRVVLPDLEQLWRLRDRLVKKHPEAKQYDYVTSPRDSGYRGVHVVAQYGPDPRPIEIQLRTVVMHSWAVMVESYSGATGINYKTDGSSDFHEMAKLLSEILDLEERGGTVYAELWDEYTTKRLQVFPRS